MPRDGASRISKTAVVAVLEAVVQAGGEASRESLVLALSGLTEEVQVQQVLGNLIAAGLLKTGPLGSTLRFALPPACFRGVLPGLWPEAEK